MLHGGPGAHHDYLLPGFDALAHGRELIYYDQRGGGRSPVPRDMPVGWREQVADLEALRKQWGLERLTLAGYSWGGLLALLYAARDPESGRAAGAGLSRAGLARGPAGVRAPFQPAESRSRASRRARALRESGLRERDPGGLPAALFELSVAAYFSDPARARDLTPFRVTGRTQQEVWASLGDYDLRPQLPALAGYPPSCCTARTTRSPSRPPGAAAELLGAEFHALPRCGHVPYVEAFEEFVA